jgi:hypothetical protein
MRLPVGPGRAVHTHVRPVEFARCGGQNASMRSWPVLAAMLLASSAQADDYREPTGFNGHPWGQAFTDFRNLVLWHANTAADSRGKVEDFRLECAPNPADPGNTCSPANSRVTQIVQGDGSHALAEYYFRYDRNPWHEQGIEVATISYLFCARSNSWNIPHPVRKHLKLCGARVIFKSDRPEELAARGEGYESNFERILHALVAEHGAPPGYERHGRITIETEDQRLAGAQNRKPLYLLYRWCGVNETDRKLLPNCGATITLSFESTSGFGTLLYATAPVYEFAYARHNMKDENNDLYVLLNSLKPGVPYRRIKHECTGSHLCSPSVSPMSAKQLREFQP